MVSYVYTYDMRKVNALTVRQSLGRVLRDLDRTGEPILVEKDRKPRAVLISIEDFGQRFVDRVAADERQQLVERIRSFAARVKRSAEKKSAVDILRELRGPLAE
jgi:PHD/YefM family antitoxin component YafN of YafNO toxin-antitoxin module